jgi:hypothetical protein
MVSNARWAFAIVLDIVLRFLRLDLLGRWNFGCFYILNSGLLGRLYTIVVIILCNSIVIIFNPFHIWYLILYVICP